MKQHIAILGPTCCWKSDCAIALAQKFDAEIISCDSMQVYKGLEIGTAQPSAQERSIVPHHLIDCMEIWEPYDANIFTQKAKNILASIEAKNKRAVIVGGTGLYARTLIYGLKLLPSDKTLAESIRLQNQTDDGHQKLLEKLVAASGGIDAIPTDILQNPRHFTRACEVLSITGKTPWQLNPQNAAPLPSFQQFILLPDFSFLKERIRKRTRKLLDMGWIDEARTAITHGLLETPTARQALGYRDIAEWDGNSINDLETILSNRTIQYARRQYTWFKHQHQGANLLNIASKEDALVQIMQLTAN